MNIREHVTYDDLVIKKNIGVGTRCVIDVLHGRPSHHRQLSMYTASPQPSLVVRQRVATSVPILSGHTISFIHTFENTSQQSSAQTIG